MTSRRDSLLGEVQEVRIELTRLLEGMDYSFDWKPEEEEWSAREVVYHLVNTPPDGIHTVLQQTLKGAIEEFSISAGLTNLTPERRESDLTHALGGAQEMISAIEEALSSTTDAELEERTVIRRSADQGDTEERTARVLVEGLFLRHWREHLGQLAALRDALGLE